MTRTVVLDVTIFCQNIMFWPHMLIAPRMMNGVIGITSGLCSVTKGMCLWNMLVVMVANLRIGRGFLRL